MPNSSRDPASIQLAKYKSKKEHQGYDSTITTNGGNPVGYKQASQTVGYRGPTLLQDWVLIDELSHFSRERIPERVVHAKGASARGHFTVFHDSIIQKYSAAKVFTPGTTTKIAVRFSQVAGEKGYPDTYRDVRGFAIKFYTEDGIWDLVGNNTPIFFVRDAAMFPSFIHALKRNPVTNIRPDYDMFFDFLSLRPETTHQSLVMFSDRGIPASYRRMHGYGANTFAFVNKEGQFFYCKFHWLTNQGVATLSQEAADKYAGLDPDFLVRDLYNAIEAGKYPSWTFYVQIMTPEQAATNPYDPFDDTKVWLHADFPLIPVGRLVLDENPSNYFAEVEQLAFDVSHLVPGIEPSPDRMLQGRMYNYGDTHRYRLGVNSAQLPINQPINKIENYSRDGFSTLISQGGAPNYYPNTFKGPENNDRARSLTPLIPLSEQVKNKKTGEIEARFPVVQRTDNIIEDNYSQARLLWGRVLKEPEKERLVQNAVNWLKRTDPKIAERSIAVNFEPVDPDLGQRVRDELAKAVEHTHVDI